MNEQFDPVNVEELREILGYTLSASMLQDISLTCHEPGCYEYTDWESDGWPTLSDLIELARKHRHENHVVKLP